MPLDVLVLGDFVFTDFAVPELLPAGGKQQLNVKKMPGGDRVVDAMGPDDDNRQFEVLHVGANALADAQTIDQMRISGQPWPYSNGVEARIVVIESSPYKVERFNVIHQTINLVPVDNPAGGAAGPLQSIDTLVGLDLASALAVVADNLANAF